MTFRDCRVTELRPLGRDEPLARPAVEAGERLGFLPGDLQEKVDPYLRPLYDALFDLVDYERVTRLLEKRVIEIAPGSVNLVDPARAEAFGRGVM